MGRRAYRSPGISWSRGRNICDSLKLLDCRGIRQWDGRNWGRRGQRWKFGDCIRDIG